MPIGGPDGAIVLRVLAATRVCLSLDGVQSRSVSFGGESVGDPCGPARFFYASEHHFSAVGVVSETLLPLRGSRILLEASN